MRKHCLLLSIPFVAVSLFLSACKNSPSANDMANDVVPAAKKDTVVGYNGCDHCEFKPLSAHSFDYVYQNYTVRIAERSDTAGIAMIVAPHRGGPHYNVQLPAGAAFAGINREFLFTDADAGSGKKLMVIYDLPGQKELSAQNTLIPLPCLAMESMVLGTD
ncbi:MAG: hypothetical protein IPL65_10805 [Lewinellaceae bacterium]|nr:hypothetical protein [Lewinellaceae bacterium]